MTRYHEWLECIARDDLAGLPLDFQGFPGSFSELLRSLYLGGCSVDETLDLLKMLFPVKARKGESVEHLVAEVIDEIEREE